MTLLLPANSDLFFPQQLWPSGNAPHSGRDVPSPTLSPSPSFASLGGPTDQATPRASAQSNPFDSAAPGLTKSTANLSLESKRAASPAFGQAPSGLKTPTSHGFMPLPLGTPGAGQPTVGVTVGDQVGQSGAIGFGLHEPPKMRKALDKGGREGARTPVGMSPPDAVEVTAAGGSSSSSGSAASTQSHHSHSFQARGTLNVKLISARGLAVAHSPSSQPQPYVVMQFEQNEYVSRPPHPVTSPASVPFTAATVQPITPGHLTRSASGLGVGTISRAFAEAVGRGKGKKEYDGSGAQTPRAEEPAGGGSWLGKPGPADPVWKEEISL